MQPRQRMEKIITAYTHEISRLSVDRLSDAQLSSILVDGSPINHLANISITTQLASITPYNPSDIGKIERAIMQANIGVTPQNDGTVVRLYAPPTSEERREELCVQARAIAEKSRVAVRLVRRDVLQQAKKDGGGWSEKKIQALTDEHIGSINEALKQKEVELKAI